MTDDLHDQVLVTVEVRVEGENADAFAESVKDSLRAFAKTMSGMGVTVRISEGDVE